MVWCDDDDANDNVDVHRVFGRMALCALGLSFSAIFTCIPFSKTMCYTPNAGGLVGCLTNSSMACTWIFVYKSVVFLVCTDGFGLVATALCVSVSITENILHRKIVQTICTPKSVQRQRVRLHVQCIVHGIVHIIFFFVEFRWWWIFFFSLIFARRKEGERERKRVEGRGESMGCFWRVSFKMFVVVSIHKIHSIRRYTAQRQNWREGMFFLHLHFFLLSRYVQHVFYRLFTKALKKMELAFVSLAIYKLLCIFVPSFELLSSGL